MKTTLFFLPVVAASAIVCSCEKAATKAATLGDATFARTTFTSLAKGDRGVESSIDWTTLRAQGKNIGAGYVALATEEDKLRFREAFVTQFASDFQASGGKVEDFTDWKVVEHDATHTVVRALTPKGVLNVTVNERDGKERVSAFEVVTTTTAP